MIKLQQIREENGISVKQISEAINISPPSIYSWEHQEKFPRVTSMYVVSEYLKSIDAVPKTMKPRTLFQPVMEDNYGKAES